MIAQLPDPATLKHAIENILSNKGPVSGAYLGSQINESFPGLKIKDVYGSLRIFVNSFCNSTIEHWQPDATGIFFKLKSDETPWPRRPTVAIEQNGSNPITGPSPASIFVPTTAWQAFSNPNSTSKVWVNKEALDLKISDQSVALEPPWETIATMSTEEHLQICKEFLPEVPAESRARFTEILQESESWPRWVVAVRSLGQGMNTQWNQFRIRRIGTTFIHRLRELEISEGAQLILLDRLRDSKHTKTPSALDKPVAKEEGKAAKSQIGQPDVELLRKIILAAVEKLPIEDLRKISLPVGVMIDVQISK